MKILLIRKGRTIPLASDNDFLISKLTSQSCMTNRFIGAETNSAKAWQGSICSGRGRKLYTRDFQRTEIHLQKDQERIPFYRKLRLEYQVAQ